MTPAQKKQREQILAEIKRRGGAAKAPGFAKQLADLDAQIATSKAAPTGGSTSRQETRLDYLKRVDPKSPEIKELENKISAANSAVGAATGPDAPGAPPKPNEPFNRQSVDQFLDGILDNFKPLDLSGAPKIMTAADLDAYRQQNQDALYNEETKYLDRNRARDMEETKQELANRGIPYDPAAAQDPNTQNLYGKTMGAINENYTTQQQSALDRARTGADQRMQTQAGVNKAASDQFVNSAVEGYNSQLNAVNAGGSLLDRLITEYGMTREEAQRELDRKSAVKIAKIQSAARNSGGGGGGGGGGESGGFEILG